MQSLAQDLSRLDRRHSAMGAWRVLLSLKTARRRGRRTVLITAAFVNGNDAPIGYGAGKVTQAALRLRLAFRGGALPVFLRSLPERCAAVRR
jgi:hypothetical protein